MIIPLSKISNGNTEISVENVNLLKDILVASLESNKEVTIKKEKDDDKCILIKKKKNITTE